MTIADLVKENDPNVNLSDSRDSEYLYGNAYRDYITVDTKVTNIIKKKNDTFDYIRYTFVYKNRGNPNYGTLGINMNRYNQDSVRSYHIRRLSLAFYYSNLLELHNHTEPKHTKEQMEMAYKMPFCLDNRYSSIKELYRSFTIVDDNRMIDSYIKSNEYLNMICIAESASGKLIAFDRKQYYPVTQILAEYIDRYTGKHIGSALEKRWWFHKEIPDKLLHRMKALSLLEDL